MGAVQQYVDLYRSQKDLINGHSSAVMNGLREEAVSLLESRGLPSLKDEEHRRTDIESVYSPDYGLNLGRIDIETNPYEVFRCDVPNLSTLLYFVVNDSFYKRVQPVSSKLPDGVLVGSLCDMSLQYPDLVSRYYGKVADMKRDGTVALNTALPKTASFCIFRTESSWKTDTVGKYPSGQCRFYGESPVVDCRRKTGAGQIAGVRSLGRGHR